MPNVYRLPKLRELRKAKGLTASALSTAIGRQYSYISRVECKEHHASEATIAKICECLGVTLDDLTDNDKESCAHFYETTPKRGLRSQPKQTLCWRCAKAYALGCVFHRTAASEQPMFPDGAEVQLRTLDCTSTTVYRIDACPEFQKGRPPRPFGALLELEEEHACRRHV